MAFIWISKNSNGKSFNFLKKSGRAWRNIDKSKNIYVFAAVQPALKYYFVL